MSDLYIPTIGLPFLLQENMWTDYKSLTDTNVEIETEATQFTEKEYINGIFISVYRQLESCQGYSLMNIKVLAVNFFLGAEKMLALILLTRDFLALVQHTQILHHWKYIFYNIFFTVKSVKMQPLKSMKDLNWSYGLQSCKNVIWCHKIHCSEILCEKSSLIFWNSWHKIKWACQLLLLSFPATYHVVVLFMKASSEPIG